MCLLNSVIIRKNQISKQFCEKQVIDKHGITPIVIHRLYVNSNAKSVINLCVVLTLSIS